MVSITGDRASSLRSVLPYAAMEKSTQMWGRWFVGMLFPQFNINRTLHTFAQTVFTIQSIGKPKLHFWWKKRKVFFKFYRKVKIHNYAQITKILMLTISGFLIGLFLSGDILWTFRQFFVAVVGVSLVFGVFRAAIGRLGIALTVVTFLLTSWIWKSTDGLKEYWKILLYWNVRKLNF